MINKKSADPVCYCFYTVMSPKEKWCCISSCKSNVNTVKCFTFPKDAVRAKQWTDSIGLKEIPSYKSKFRVCEKHFSKEFFSRDLRAELLNLPNRLLLHPDAVPSLNVHQPIEAVLQADIRSPLLGNYLNLNLCLYIYKYYGKLKNKCSS